MAFRNNFGNPQGFIGRLMLSGMNMGHSPMAKWAFTQFDVPDDGMLVDIGCAVDLISEDYWTAPKTVSFMG